MVIVHSIEVENFKSFRKPQKVTFAVPDGTLASGLTIIVGENNSGKSSLPEMFRWVNFKKQDFKGEKHSRKKTRIKLEVSQDLEKSYGSRWTTTWEFGRNKFPKFATEGEESLNFGSMHLPYILTKRTWSGSQLIDNFEFYDNAIEGSRYYWYDHDDDAVFFDELKKYLGSVLISIHKEKETKKQLDELMKKIVDFNDWTIDEAGGEKILMYIRKDGTKHPFDLIGDGLKNLFIMFIAIVLGHDFIIFIDEPEQGLSPQTQIKLAKVFCELAKDAQVVVLTHSPYIYKEVVNEKSSVFQFRQNKNNFTEILDLKDGKNKIFKYSPSWGEINFLALDVPTIEFHNELYGHIQSHISSIPIEEFFSQRKERKTKIWIEEKKGKLLPPKKVTLHTFIRHKIHHPENKTMSQLTYSEPELRKSIVKLIDFVRMLNRVSE